LIRSDAQMEQGGEAAGFTKRQLFLRDSLFFLVLSVITAVLAGVTFFLFRSFEAHREELAVRWSTRGQQAIQQGRPDQAVKALRVALSYAPDNRSYQLLLAQALADSAQIDEATDYFLTLRDTQPGDGFINLELARLARRQNHSRQAIDYYRASIFGDWRGDGAIRRRQVRLELADYLTEQKDPEAARAELLIAQGNAPDNAAFNLLFGDKLEATGDTVDALAAYRKAILDNPHDQAALVKAGTLAYSLGDYTTAHRLLARALEAKQDTNGSDVENIRAMAQNAERLIDLSLSRELPAHDRAAHLLVASKIAQARLNQCAQAQNGTLSLPALKARWRSISGMLQQKPLEENAEAQDNIALLVFDTEQETAKTCGAPTGDDALLLTLAQSQSKTSQQNGAPE
jgi:tetratricopeptide (TPR) repeat protein